MSVVETDAWLQTSWEKPIEMCEKLTFYFPNVPPTDIYRHFIMYGMYSTPLARGNEIIDNLKKKQFWKIVADEEVTLKKKWDGPDVPIFIFPSDPNNVELKEQFNGKSGLAFRDKLFLFLADYNTKHDIQALFTHEYNHVCRLNKYNKNEADYILLDTIILEGLAENAVRERWNGKFTAHWTTHYTEEELHDMWRQFVLPFYDLPKHHPEHQQILYGWHFYPKMTGYCVGYYLVKRYMKKYKQTVKDLLPIPSEEIAQI